MRKRKIELNLLIFMIGFLCLIGLFISIFNIIKWKLDSNEIINETNDILDIVKIEEINDEENVEIIEQVEEIPSFNPY